MAERQATIYLAEMERAIRSGDTAARAVDESALQAWRRELEVFDQP